MRTYYITTPEEWDEDYEEQIVTALDTLLKAVEGTIPGFREFGMPIDIMDLTEPEARNEFAAALDEKVERFIPMIRIEQIDYSHGDDNSVVARITVADNELSEEEEEE